MADYKKLYYSLFNAVTDAIEDLKKIQVEAEEKYLKSCEEDGNDEAEEFLEK